MSARQEKMSSVDHAWLRMERDDNPMMITAVMVLETSPDPDRLRQVLEQRLLKFERFRQRVVRDGDSALWENDPHFHLDNHLHRIGLPAPGGREALQQLVSDLASTPLDPRHPLWQTHIVEQYGEGAALISRIHHCIADGIALVRVMLSLADEEPDAAPVPEKETGHPGFWHPAQRLVRNALHLGHMMADEALDLVRHPDHWLDLAGKAVDMGEELTRVTFSPADRSGPLKGELSGRKNVAWVDPLDLERVKDVAHALGGKVNDVLMACATSALRGYLLDRQKDVDREIHVAVPFNLRPLDKPVDTLGNQFGFVIARLPVHVSGVRERYEQVRENMTRLKQSPQPLLFYGMLNAFGRGPEVLERVALDVLSNKSSLVMTNVPGPRKPLYIAGARVLQPLVWVPQSGHLGIGLSILSYAGTVQFGVIADERLVPNPDELVAHFHAAFETLSALTDETPAD